jgi:hypothetical protein
MWTDFRKALVVTRREIRDQFRDWRILAPIIILTVFFPGLMNFTAQQAVDFVAKYGAPIIADRLIPFLLMVVGFFPISVSLVIALESFVGEKERRSIEPLLSSPLTDVQLYLGKLMAVIFPPLIASFLGITVYLVGVGSRSNIAFPSSRSGSGAVPGHGQWRGGGILPNHIGTSSQSAGLIYHHPYGNAAGRGEYDHVLGPLPHTLVGDIRSGYYCLAAGPHRHCPFQPRGAFGKSAGHDQPALGLVYIQRRFYWRESTLTPLVAT